MEGVPMPKDTYVRNHVLDAIDAGLYFYFPNEDEIVTIIPPIIVKKIDVLKQVSI